MKFVGGPGEQLKGLYRSAGLSEAGGRGAAVPQILEGQKAPPGNGSLPHYYLSPQIFRLCDMPEVYYRYLRPRMEIPLTYVHKVYLVL